ENPTDEDWKSVRMALISGRPISFQMDLYTPLYVPRPLVVPELFQSLRPVAYSGAIESQVARARVIQQQSRQLGGETRRKRVEFEMWHESTRPPAPPMTPQSPARMDLQASGVTTAASAARLGDYFQYAIDKPVSLARQKSALLPIVGKDVEATRVSI